MHTKIIEQIDNLQVRSQNQPLSDTLKYLAAALQCHGFTISFIMVSKNAFDPNDNVATQFSRPGIHIESPEAGKIRYKYSDITEPRSEEWRQKLNELTEVNVVETIRLFNLLAEFNDLRTVPFYARLILLPMATASCELISQGSVIRIMLDQPTRDTWLKEGEAEMLAFAEFLGNKLD